MSEISLVLPEIGQADKTQDPKIVTAFTQIQTAINGNIGGPNVEPELTGLRLVQTARAKFGAGSEAAGVYFPTTQGTCVKAAALAATGQVNFGYLAASDFAVTGKTTELTLKVDLLTNATAPGVKLTFGLYNAEQYGGAEEVVTVKYEAVVAGSTLKFEPLATQNYTLKTTFAFPAAKNPYYSIGFETSGATAAAASLLLSAQLFVSNT